MLDIQKAIYTRLAADATLTGLLATFAGAPAIFSSRIHADHTLGDPPTIIISQPKANTSDDDASDDWREALVDCRVYNIPNGSTSTLNQAGERARTVLKSWPVETIDGAVYQAAAVTGPVEAPTSDPSADGLLVSVRLRIKE